MNEELRERIEKWEDGDTLGLRDMEHFADALIAALREAEEVAEAVTWCEKNANLVELKAGGKWLVDDGWHNEMQAGLPAAVSALRQRVEGKPAPEGDAKKGEGSNG